MEPLPQHLRKGLLHMMINKGVAPLHDIKKNVWRVPIKVVEDEFKVWVSANYFRIFNKQTLPDVIKSRLAIIRARDCQLSAYGGVDFEIAASVASPLYGLIYLAEDIDGMEDTGWRVNEDYYTVILPNEDMVSLRGESINNDSRRKSKNKG